jgi:hypothetical protein
VAFTAAFAASSAAATNAAALWLPAPALQDPEEHPVADIAQLGRPYGQELALEQWPAALVGLGRRLLLQGSTAAM